MTERRLEQMTRAITTRGSAEMIRDYRASQRAEEPVDS
jgi:hypothetical protein